MIGTPKAQSKIDFILHLRTQTKERARVERFRAVDHLRRWSGGGGQRLVEVIVDGFRQFRHVRGEEVIGARDRLEIDDNVFLMGQPLCRFSAASGGTTSSRAPCRISPEAGHGARNEKSRDPAGGDTAMKPSISGLRISSCMPIHAPKE